MCYVKSTGEAIPYRVKWRTGSFYSTQILREILIEVAKVKKYTFHFKQLSGDEIQKYKHITFYEPETDLEKLTEEEINTFYNFTEQSVFIFRRNPYNTGFYQNMIDIIKGQ